MRWGQFCARSLLCSIVLFAGGLLALVSAQTPVRPPARKPRTIVLPEMLVANQPATLAVLDVVGRLMPGVAVELSGRPPVTTDATGRAAFLAPAGPGVLIAWTAAHAITATSTIKQDVPAASGAPADHSAPPAPPPVSVVSYPQFLSLYDRFSITGSGFRGIADGNHVFVADQPCLVLAASPVNLVVLPGMHIPIGAAVLRLNVSPVPGATPPAQSDVSKPLAIVLLEVSGPAQTVRAGAQGMLTIQARGTAERVQVEVRNSSPAVVQLAGGNVQRIITSGGDPNVAQLPMKFLASGDYTVTARLISDTPAPLSGT